MKKTICKVEYDTDTAIFVAKYVEGPWGDPKGFEECLFQTESGKFFLYVNGGEESEHAGENITRMSAARAEAWRAERGV